MIAAEAAAKTVHCRACGGAGHNARTCGRAPRGSGADRRARMARARQLGHCQPCAVLGRTREARSGRATCEEHARAMQKSAIRRRKRRAAKGQCYRCKEPATVGRFCAAHAAREASYGRRNVTRDQKIRDGLCVTPTCEGTAIDHRKCASCRKLEVEKAMQRYEERRADGLCYRCGVAPADGGFESCEGCRKKHRVKPDERKRRPYGFLFHKGKLIPDPREQLVIAVVREGRAHGISFERIAKDLNAQGRRTRLGKAFYAATVREIALALVAAAPAPAAPQKTTPRAEPLARVIDGGGQSTGAERRAWLDTSEERSAA